MDNFVKTISTNKRWFFCLLTVVLISLFFNLIIGFYRKEIWFDLIENLLFIYAISLPLFFIKKNKWYKNLTILFFTLFTYIETCFYLLFASFVGPSTIFVVLETNNQEAIEFLNFYSNYTILILGVLLFIVVIYYYYYLKNKKNHFYKISKKLKIKLIFSLLIIGVILKTTKLITYNLPYLIIKSFSVYKNEINQYASLKEKDFYGVFNDISKKEDSIPEVHIIVIGESTSRSHFSLYNKYYRKTTPMLSRIKDELLVFDNVISSDVYTIKSVPKALSLKAYDSDFKVYNGTLIQVLRKAGYKTYWYSNQRPIGSMDTKNALIGKSCDEYKFINSFSTRETTPLDSNLLPLLNTSFEDNSAKKKVIFLHILGTHFDYKKRYPEEFNFFKEFNSSKEKLSKKKLQVINEYDNSILFNDYLLNKIIAQLKKLKIKSSMTYFSDHGEELTAEKFYGHAVDVNTTLDMYEIPFLVWLSKDFNTTPTIINPQRPYMLDDFIHSYSDLLNISSKELKREKSIFSNDSIFKKRDRMVSEGNKLVDFDVFFEK